MKTLLTTLLLSFLVACDYDHGTEPDPLAHRLPGRSVTIFRLPDSVAADRLIAAYEEEIPYKCVSYIFYDDSTRTSATKISQYGDRVLREKLRKEAGDLFCQVSNPGFRYVIRKDYVDFSQVCTGIETTQHYPRTDNSN